MSTNTTCVSEDLWITDTTDFLNRAYYRISLIKKKNILHIE
jgi:hypothetical protein